MSVEFSNAYQEILLDNLTAIIKQNFIFQTQIKLAEKIGKEKEELSKKFEELNIEYEKLKSDVKQLEVYKNKAEQNNSAHEEKSRIQSALNEEMKKNSSLKSDLQNALKEVENLKKQLTEIQVNKEKELSDLKVQNEKLEELVSPAKLKKLNSETKEVFEEKNDTPKIKNNLQKILDGSSF
jgi:predicted  nucleic acid-binding Zn-ribbon protein